MVCFWELAIQFVVNGVDCIFTFNTQLNYAILMFWICKTLMSGYLAAFGHWTEPRLPSCILNSQSPQVHFDFHTFIHLFVNWEFGEIVWKLVQRSRKPHWTGWNQPCLKSLKKMGHFTHTFSPSEESYQDCLFLKSHDKQTPGGQ